MTTLILDGDNLIVHKELDFFLKGNTSLDEITEKKPAIWVDDAGWKDIQSIGTLGPALANFQSDLTNNIDEFKKWYDSLTPETTELPMQYSKITTF